MLDSVLNHNDTSYVYTFEDEVRYCQILTVNVLAVSALGPSVPGSVSRGFPIGELLVLNYCYASNLLRNSIMICVSLTVAPRPFQSGGVNVEVTFQDNESPVATISFVVCI